MKEESANPLDKRELHRFAVGRISMGFLSILGIFIVVIFDMYVQAFILIAYVIVTAFTIKALRTHLNRVAADPDVSSEAYFEAIKGMNPHEGVDYIISYIRDPQWGCPQTDIEEFLLYLAKRDDKFGQAAREKLNERGDWPND